MTRDAVFILSNSNTHSGVDTDAMVNSLLSECSWGVVDTPTPPPDGQQLPPRSWRLLSPEPSATPPAVGLCMYVCKIHFAARRIKTRALAYLPTLQRPCLRQR